MNRIDVRARMHFTRIMKERTQHKDPVSLQEYIRRLDVKVQACAVLHDYDSADYYLRVIAKLRLQQLFEVINYN